MKVLVATSEAIPFAKTGGLADVCGALPVELTRLGQPTALILPAYRRAKYCGLPIDPLGIDFVVPVGSKTVTGHLLASKLPGSEVPVYLVQQDQYYDRDELYRKDGEDYDDNCERFVFFSRAVLEAIRLVGLEDQVHAIARDLPIGNRKRLEVARALATGPELLLLDEPCGGLNPTEVKKLMGLMRTIVDRGITIFLIEHVMQAIMNVSDRIMVLHHGEKIAEGKPAEVAVDPRVVQSYLGEEYCLA